MHDGAESRSRPETPMLVNNFVIISRPIIRGDLTALNHNQ